MGRLARIVVVLVLSVSCGPPFVQVLSYRDSPALMAHPPGCTMRVYDAADALPASCEPIGDVFVGEGGSSVDCGRDDVLELVREQSCLFGADAYQLIRVSEPTGGSSCHQARARFLRCASTPEGDPS